MDKKDFEKEKRMSSISDVIEDFILETLGDDNELDLSRNDLAIHFSCAPSQINYVLTTRFSPTRGYLIESHRGGGGFVRITKLDLDDGDSKVNKILGLIGNEVTYNDAVNVLAMLVKSQIITAEQAKSSQVLMSDKAIANPFRFENYIRANMLKALIYDSLKEED